MIEIHKNTKYIFILLISAYFFFIFGNGVLSLTNPDEVFYAQTAKEMVKHSSWLTPYLFDASNFEKPIFLYWLLRVGFILFGVSSFAARFFPAAFAALGVLAVYCLGMVGFKDSRKAFYSALVLMSSGLYMGLARTVFTDMIFSVLILLSLLSFFWGYLRREKKGISLIIFFACSALAVLTKGPLGLIIPFFIIILFLWFRRELRYLWCAYAVWGVLIFIAIALPWYIYMLTKYKNAFTHEFFYNDHIRRIVEAEHKANDTWYFYPFSMIACMFPWSIFALVSLYSLIKKRLLRDKPIYLFLACWIAVVFAVFQFAHSKLVSYIFPLFPALALLIGGYIFDSAAAALRNNSMRMPFVLTWCMLLLLPIALPVGLILYPQYAAIKTPLYFFIILFSCLLLLMLRFILRHEFFKVICLMTLIVPLILVIVPFIKNDIEPYISSKTAGEYIANAVDANSVVLCSKPFVRGIRYYADRKVAALGNNVFSPHPIPFLDSDEKIKGFLNTQTVTYCVIKKSDLKDMERIIEQRFNLISLKTIGNEYIVTIQPVRN